MLAHPIERPGGTINAAQVRPYTIADAGRPVGWPRGEHFELREFAFKAGLPEEVVLDLDLADIEAIEAECRRLSALPRLERPNRRAPTLRIYLR